MTNAVKAARQKARVQKIGARGNAFEHKLQHRAAKKDQRLKNKIIKQTNRAIASAQRARDLADRRQKKTQYLHKGGFEKRASRQAAAAAKALNIADNVSNRLTDPDAIREVAKAFSVADEAVAGVQALNIGKRKRKGRK